MPTTRDPIDRLRAQIERFGLHTGVDQTEVLDEGYGEAEVTSKLGSPVLVNASRCAAALEALPDDAPVAEEDGDEDNPSVWGVIVDHDRS